MAESVEGTDDIEQLLMSGREILRRVEEVSVYETRQSGIVGSVEAKDE